jgi:hypothetical protein
MRHRLLIYLLLWAFGLWASGAMRWLHEELDHHAGRAAARIGAASPAGGTGAIASAEHSHHDCPICQMLAAMSATRGPHLPSPAAPQDPVPRARPRCPVFACSCPVAWLEPTRGPPAMA